MNARHLARELLEEFARTRAPLVADAPAAVMRAIALASVAVILERAPEREVRIMAARTLDVHLCAAPASKRAASKQEFATASALFADVIRSIVNAKNEHAVVNELIARLGAFDDERDARSRTLRWFSRATMITAMLKSVDPRLQLRAARWILSRTRALAEQVGYGEPTDPAPPSGELPPQAAEGVPVPVRCNADRPATTPSVPFGDSSPDGGAGIELRSRPPP